MENANQIHRAFLLGAATHLFPLPKNKGVAAPGLMDAVEFDATVQNLLTEMSFKPGEPVSPSWLLIGFALQARAHGGAAQSL